MTQVWEVAQSNRKEVVRFVKFAMVGALGAVTDFAVLNVMVQFVGAALIVANTISFTAAVCQNFVLNRYWTFPESRERQAGRQLVQFVVVSLIGLGLNQLVFLSVHHLLEPTWQQWIANGATAFLISYNFAKLFATGVVLFWNFLANRLWTYRGL